MISWSTVIHHKGENDLLFIGDYEEWSGDPDLHYFPYSEGDVMIDCNGKIYSLPYNKEKKRVEIYETGSQMSLTDFEELIKKHLRFVRKNSEEKITIKTFLDGIEMVEETNV